MKRYILLILLPFLLIGFKSKAQDSLTISPYSVYVGNDTLAPGASDSIGFYVVNSATTPFIDSMGVYLSVLDATFTSLNPIDSLFTGPIILAAGDSIPVGFPVDYTISPVRFHLDINVIVIWPLTASSVSVDSLYYSVYIDSLLGVGDEIDIGAIVNAFPNPVVHHLSIANNSKKPIEEVRIYDARGRFITKADNPDFICTEDWSYGTYIIRVRMKDGRIYNLKVIKQ